METDDDLDNIFEDNGNETENKASTTDSSSAIKVPPLKRIVKNPRLKFNPERLCGERGIPVLVDHFKNVKFKGKGHEKEDLDKLLTNLEHWTHRLFPSMKFEDCLHQIEKLGKKRPVQTCLRKIRLDMPILNSDFVKDDEEDNVKRNDDSDPEPLAVDAFDRLIQESQNILNQDDSSTRNVEIDSAYSSPVFHTNQGQALGSSFASSLTEEQKKRMEHNRLLAAERRKAKLAAKEIDTSLSESPNIISTTSQDISSTFVSLLASSKSTFNKDNILDKADTSDNLFDESTPLCLVDEYSENLGLDDLIDLVDENEPVPVKNIQSVKVPINVNKKFNEISLDVTVPLNFSSPSPNTNVDAFGEVLKNDLIGLNKASEIINTDYANFKSLGIVDKDAFASDKMITTESTRQNTGIYYNFNEENENCLEDTLPIRFSNSNINILLDIPCNKKVESNETNLKSLEQETVVDIINYSNSKDLKQSSSDSYVRNSGKVLNCSEIAMCDNENINSVENENSTSMHVDN